MTLPWRAWLIYFHRWLGIAGGLLFLVWFVSGIAMIYVRMPDVTPEERLLHAEPLDASALQLTPAEAAANAGIADVAGVRLSMLEGRPVYRFPGPVTKTVFADRGEVLAGLAESAAMEVARRWSPAQASSLRYGGLITIPDQWTLQTRQHLPLHQIALGDAGDSRLYVSSRTGEVVMETTRRERFWAYWGPIAHWLYLPVLRRNGPLWTQVIIWLSGIGCVMCVAGIALGLVQYSPSARYRLQGGRARSPYTGLVWWHHYVGLAFGVVTLTWTFSGLLSMGPFAWLSSGPITAEQRGAVTGTPHSLDGITVPRIRGAIAAVRNDFVPRELTLTFFQGEPFWIGDAAPPAADAVRTSALEDARSPHRLISAIRPESGAFQRFDDAAMERVAREAMPGVAIEDETWLRKYDTYYYDRPGASPLPVLRVRYADAQRTWLYLDPQHGTIALMSRPRGRLNRWLYQGLHSLDLPVLYDRRPLWDIVVIALSLGGIALGATTLLPAWRRIRRHAERLVGRSPR